MRTRTTFFFYRIEAVATGHVPITQMLAAASVERLATVIPHEDFHLQVRDLPDRVAEAATTLVGFWPAPPPSRPSVIPNCGLTPNSS